MYLASSSEIVQNPSILPKDRVFIDFARISFYSPTPESRIYYTTDGKDPSEDSNLAPAGSNILFDTPGIHVIKAIAVADDLIPSDIVTKTFEIFKLLPAPDISPAPGSYKNSFNLTISCPRRDFKVCYQLQRVGFAQVQKCILCPFSRTISDLGTYKMTYFYSLDGITLSASGEAEYSMVTPAYDEWPVFVNKKNPIQFKPKIEIFSISKDVESSSPSCSKRNIRGHHIILHNPIGHFNVLPPAGGCGHLDTPSTTAKQFKLKSGASTVSERLFRSYVHRLSGAEVLSWRAQHESYSATAGTTCSVVTNAGFFNISNNACFGNVVTQGKVIQTSKSHNVNFGIRNGSFVVGYVDEGEVLDESNRFETLVTGLIWLVRRGSSFVTESLTRSGLPVSGSGSVGTGEDMSIQSNGPNFARILSARTAIGHDSSGRLMILQVEGKSFERGMDLHEFANYCVELGFISAINLDGGGSATITALNELISEPSNVCSSTDNQIEAEIEDDDGPTLAILSGQQKYRMCEKPVSSVTCMHPIPPPEDDDLTPEQMREISELLSSTAPTRRPSSAVEPPVKCSPVPTLVPSTNNYSNSDLSVSLQSSLANYQTATFGLSILLVLSITLNGWWYITYASKKRIENIVVSSQISHEPTAYEMTRRVDRRGGDYSGGGKQHIIDSRGSRNSDRNLDEEYGIRSGLSDTDEMPSDDDSREYDETASLNPRGNRHVGQFKDSSRQGAKQGFRVFNPFSKRK